MLTTPAGISVCSAISRPTRVAFQGVSGAGLSTTVLPVANAWASLCRVISTGKFQGTMAPTTPAGSLTTRRRLMFGASPVSGSSRSQANVSIAWVGHVSASASGMSSCGP